MSYLKIDNAKELQDVIKSIKAEKNIVADYIEGEYKESTNKSFRRDSYADKCR